METENVNTQEHKINEVITMAERLNDTTDWPDLFVGLYDRLTGSNAEITYASDNM